MDKAIGWGFALLALVIITLAAVPRDIRADAAIARAVSVPVA